MSLPALKAGLKVSDGRGSEVWWYDSARCMFVVGLWPIIENCWSEELARQVADEPGPSRRKAFAAHLLTLVPQGAAGELANAGAEFGGRSGNMRHLSPEEDRGSA